MARIDLGDEDSGDSLADALRQLEEQQKKGARPKEEQPADQEESRRRFEERREAERERSREDVEEAVEAIRERKEAVEGVPERRAAGTTVRWVVIALVIAGAIAAAAVAFWPQPLPPPATTPEAAVRGFWDAVIAGNYEGATVYYPALVSKYGSRKQAAVYLEQVFRDDPPMGIAEIGEPEPLPETEDLRVTYEIWRRSGRPRTGEFIVRYSEGARPGYIIVTGP